MSDKLPHSAAAKVASAYAPDGVQTVEATMPQRSKKPIECKTARGTPAGKDLAANLIEFSAHAAEFASPDEMLDALQIALQPFPALHVLAAARFPRKVGDWTALKPGETLFVHKHAPQGWWRDYSEFSQRSYDPGIMMARTSLAPFTWTEGRRMIEPIGADRWAWDLAMKHGMRDGLTCPVGGRWVMTFWSRKVLTDILTMEARALVFMASSFAIMRIEKGLRADADQFPSRPLLTAREQAVLQMAAAGYDVKAIAGALKLGAETIRTHLRKAKQKLIAKNRTHAVAEAIRQSIIP
jgi:DNA-binding CsgD family transcriptional regulator